MSDVSALTIFDFQDRWSSSGLRSIRRLWSSFTIPTFAGMRSTSWSTCVSPAPKPEAQQVIIFQAVNLQFKLFYSLALFISRAGDRRQGPLVLMLNWEISLVLGWDHSEKTDEACFQAPKTGRPAYWFGAIRWNGFEIICALLVAGLTVVALNVGVSLGSRWIIAQFAN